MNIIASVNLAQMVLGGAVIGFLTGLFLSTGPLSAPAFLALGLVRGAFIATEATASLIVQMAKIVSFHEFGAISMLDVARGAAIGLALMLGTFAIRPLVARIRDHHFRAMMDAVSLVSGLWLLIFGLFQAA